MGVTGIGGVFFRAADPKALKQWYHTHFGIMSLGYTPWEQMAGPTLMMPFKQDTDHFPPEKQWMINLRVDNLEELLGKLRAAGLDIVTNPEWDTPETGKFARVHDPEGNPIELWEPPLE